MVNNKQNIPYFNFLILPLIGERVNEILKKVDEGVIHFTKVNTEECVSRIIKKGTHLFNYKSPLESIDDIENATIEDESNVYSLEDINTLRKENNDYFAKSNGFLISYANIIKFIPITYNSTCELKVSNDKMRVIAKVYPASKEGKHITENDVIKKLKAKDISVNLEMLEINRALSFVNKNNEVIDVVVAKGKEVVLAKKAWTEYLFNTERKTGPVINEDGTIDFHNLNLIESVSANQKVGIFHPMVEGVNGFDVFGNKIVPQKLKDIKPPKGKNVYYSEKEPTHMLSKIDGYIALVGREIVVSNIYNVRGDIDLNTGNIVSKGSLNITGNVKSGFNLDMSENITIGGYVKDSILVAGGDVTIRSGFSGTGEGKITSGGNVNIRYIRNQTIYSRGDISAEKEVVEAKLFAKGDIKSLNNNMLLIGGHATAGGSVIVKSLGHEYGMETIVEVGYDYEVIAQIKKYNILYAELHNDLQTIKKQIETTLSGGGVSRLAKALLIKQQMMKKKYEELKTKRKELKDSLSTSSNSKVIVSGKIYPGVKIYIDGYKFKVKKIMQSKVFFASEDEEGIVVTDK